MCRSHEIHSVMTPSPITIGDDQLLDTAKHLMAFHGVHHLPVLRGGRCVGILSDRDIKLAYAVEPEKAKTIQIADAYTDEVITASPSDSIREVAAAMAEKRIGSVVITEGEKVVGIFTVTDACRVLADGDRLEKKSCGRCSDSSIGRV